MAAANDLKIKIPLTPSQESLFPEIIKKINADPTMLMGRLSLKKGSLEASCFDLQDVMEALAGSASPLELHRFKKQAHDVLNGLGVATESSHLKKNYQAALAALK